MDSEFVPSASSVDSHLERIIKKIPGRIAPPPKEKDVYMGNLSIKSIADLKELLERQVRILSNKSLLNNLADKGRKATELKRRIECELKSRDEVEKAANLLSEMSLKQLNALEWTGHCNPGHQNKPSSHASNLDLEETDPLKILASHSGTTAQKKMLSILKPEDSLIKAEDLISSKDFNSENNPKEVDVKGSDTNSSDGITMQHSLEMHPVSDEPEPYAHSICERYGHKEIKERFKPNKPIKPFTGVFPLKPTGRISSKPKHWEETNVTPPVPIYADSKLLSLEESLEIQREQNLKLKEVQFRHAAERLSSLHGLSITEQIPVNVLSSMAYRGAADDNSDSGEEIYEELEELHDEDQQDRGGTVVYNIES